MQKFLTVFLFLLLTVAIWFVWKGGLTKQYFVTEGIVSTETEKTPTRKGVRRKEKVSVELPDSEAPLEVIVEADENGIFLSKIGDLEVNQRLSDKEIISLDIKNGILKFWEINEETNQLKFKSINLVEFLLRLDQIAEID